MSSSERKIESARANGAKSSGPKTEEGKNASRLNGLKHGLTAETVVLPDESETGYCTQLHEYLDHFHPVGKPEDDLVHQLAAVHWRLARYAGVESGLLSKKMADKAEYIDEWEDLDQYTRLAIAFDALSGANSALALLNRYQARLHHEYQRTLKALVETQAAREAREAKLRSEPNPNFEQPPAHPALAAGPSNLNLTKPPNSVIPSLP